MLLGQGATARLTGQVLDQAGNAIPNTSVVVEAGNSSLQVSADGAGTFTFDKLPAQSGVLRVEAVGYAPAQVDWSANGRPEVHLAVTLRLKSYAEQIIVTATRSETTLEDTPASVVVLSDGRLSSTAALMVDDMLRQVPGFSLFRRSGSRTANPTTQGASLRGLSSSGASRTLVLADGVPLNDPFGSWVYWDRIPRTSIASIELLRGGASSLYGNEALGGVIDLRTRQMEAPTVALDISYGNENTPDVSFSAGEQVGKWGVMLGGEAYRSSGYVLVAPDEAGTIDTPASSEFLTGYERLDRQIGNGGHVFVGANLLGESRHNGTPFQLNNTRIAQLAVGGDWQSTAGAFQVRAYGGNEIYNQNFSSIATDRDSETPTRQQRVPSVPIGGSVQWSRAAGKRQMLLAGFEGLDVRGHSHELVYASGVPSAISDNGGRQTTLSVFGGDIIRLAERWDLTLNARYDYWRNYDALSSAQPLNSPTATVVHFDDRSESAFTPKVALLYHATSNVALNASVYRAFRAPTLNELYRSFRQGNVLTLANPELRAERLTGGEFGTIVSGFDQHLFVRGGFFWSEVSRPVANVTLTSTPTLITRMRENLGTTRSIGFEVEAESHFARSFFLSGGFQYVAATVLDFSANPSLVGLDIPQVPRHQFMFQARYAPSRWVFSAQGRAVGLQYDDDQNLLPLDAFFALDGMISRRVRRNLEIYGAVENIFNQRYQVAKTPVLNLGPPILGRAGVRWTFSPR
jgi:outer membrane receptor protein involved in Fe transport